MPERVQRSRHVKGSMLGAVYVGRPTRWGNPIEISKTKDGDYILLFEGSDLMPYLFRGKDAKVHAIEKAVSEFRDFAKTMLEDDGEWLSPLKGKNLACWCPLNQPCHADILLELAN